MATPKLIKVIVTEAYLEKFPTADAVVGAEIEVASSKELTAFLKENPDAVPTAEAAAPAVTLSYVWLKVRAFVTDKTRWEKGFYKVEGEVPARLAKLSSNDCEVFTTDPMTLSSGKLAKIAAWCGMRVEDQKDEEIIAKLATTPKELV